MRKYLFIFSILFLFSCNFFVSGSYGNAEYYDFQFSTQELISRINKFKESNPQYDTKKYSGGSDKSGNFYTVYFYLEDEEAEIHCVLVTGNGRNSTNGKIGFTGIDYNNDVFGWKSLNTNNLSKEENERLKAKFETEILDKLGKWEH